jgi:hypothetical protein
VRLAPGGRSTGRQAGSSGGVLAVAELRRLNPPGVLQLRQALALYEWEQGGPGQTG